LSLKETLEQLPGDLQITVRAIGGEQTYTDRVSWMLEDAERNVIRLEDFELLTDVTLVGQNGHDPQPKTSPDFDIKVDIELEKLRVNSRARQILKTEQRAPERTPEILTLKDRLLIDHPPVRWRIQDWQPAGTRAMLAAQYKAGKTTLTGNLARCLADGAWWLDKYEVMRTEGLTTIVDFEMGERQIDGWLKDQGIGYTERIQIAPMRGKATAFNILDEQTRHEWAERLKGTEYLILDCLRPVMDALGLDEHHDAGQFLTAFDELCDLADIEDALIVHHMGHSGERSRGDSRLRDWPDVEWRLVRESDDPASPRYISAFGRDVDVTESQLVYNPETRHLSFIGGNRANAAARGAVDDILTVLVEEGEPMAKTTIEKRVMAEYDHSQKSVRDGLSIAIHSGQVSQSKGAHGAILCTPSDAQLVSSLQLVTARQRGPIQLVSSSIEQRGGDEVNEDPETDQLVEEDELPDPW